MENTSNEAVELYDVSAVKKRLLDYRDIEREIDNQVERIENLEAKMYSVGSPELSDMPKAPSITQDRIGGMVARKEEMEAKVHRLIDRQTSEREWIQNVLKHVKKPDERAVIEMRYIDMESWPQIALMLFGKKPDFDDREESYVRRTTKLHGKALINMAIYVYQSEGAH